MTVADTHAWVWWVGAPNRLSSAARERLDEAARDGGIHVSSISVWEVAALVRRGRLELTLELGDWLAACESLPYFRFVSVDNHVALQAELLPEELPEDPADRLILATANALGADVVTKDRAMRRYLGGRAVW